MVEAGEKNRGVGDERQKTDDGGRKREDGRTGSQIKVFWDRQAGKHFGFRLTIRGWEVTIYY